MLCKSLRSPLSRALSASSASTSVRLAITSTPRASAAATSILHDRFLYQETVRKFGSKCKSRRGGVALPNKKKELELAQIQDRIRDTYKEGNYHKAREASKSLLKKTDKHFGKFHPATASAHNNLGLLNKMLGDFIESRKHYNQALKIYKDVVGKDHASYANTLHNLANLNKSQIHFDLSLKPTDRLSLVESALEFLEEALEIRKVELGDDHPHTVATRGSLGSTLAAQLLHEHNQNAAAATAEAFQKQQQNREKDSKSSSTPNHLLQASQRGWDAAEEHLREALQTAIDSPHGQQEVDRKDKVRTLSAATAAQNLAVFLRTRHRIQADKDESALEEAKRFYQQALLVRTELLSPNHPDLYTTKYSLAELLEQVGDSEGATLLRQEILDAYDPDGSQENKHEKETK